MITPVALLAGLILVFDRYFISLGLHIYEDLGLYLLVAGGGFGLSIFFWLTKFSKWSTLFNETSNQTPKDQ
jgi:hypothetical protein